MDGLSRVVAVIAVVMCVSLGQANAADMAAGAARDHMATAGQGDTIPVPPGMIARPKGTVAGCTLAKLQTTDPMLGAGIDACLGKVKDDLLNNRPLHFVSCTGPQLECCVRAGLNEVFCSPIDSKETEPSPTVPKAPAGLRMQ